MTNKEAKRPQHRAPAAPTQLQLWMFREGNSLRCRWLFPALLLLAGALVLAACRTNSASSTTGSAKTGTEKAEVEFMQDMVPHHVQAVAMAKTCLAKASHPELKTLCANIISSQQKEIDSMKSWAKSWYSVALSDQPSKARGAMSGMSSADVGSLASLSGNAYDLRFLDMMSEHHKSAIQAAQLEQPQAVHPEIRSLTTAIVSSQQAEIAQMQAWKTAWS